jgi:hypothetical protein
MVYSYGSTSWVIHLFTHVFYLEKSILYPNSNKNKRQPIYNKVIWISLSKGSGTNRTEGIIRLLDKPTYKNTFSFKNLDYKPVLLAT